jgi:adenosylcobyric acid synthase
MIQGTASHVGKSVLTAALARWLKDQGLRVAPFKAQNMSLNSFVTPRGEEIARSQAVQAEALGLEPSADMNPVLLKPMESGCQVIVQGHGVGVMSIQQYYAFKPRAWQAIVESYQRLAGGFDAVVLEGAGSPAEINLKEHDLVNMRMAAEADAAVVLVADIERGGVFAQIVGTWELLEPHERQRVVGFLINKFRGDASLLASGLTLVQERTQRPVLGVLPFDPQVQLDEEDSLGIEPAAATGEIDVAVVRLPGLSNFTDFAALAWSPGVSVRYLSRADELYRPDLVILPGTRTTVAALDWLKAVGLDQALQQLVGDPAGPLVLGVCGGCQLLGQSIHDPEGVESHRPHAAGLGLLDLETVFQPRKTLYRVEAEVIGPGRLGAGCPIIGYEVHQGTSVRRQGASAWLRLRRQPGGQTVEDGAVRPDGRVYGTYVHGLFDDARFCRALVAELRRRRGLPPLLPADWLSRRDHRANQYRHLADWLQAHCDLRPIASRLGLAPGRDSRPAGTVG